MGRDFVLPSQLGVLGSVISSLMGSGAVPQSQVKYEHFKQFYAFWQFALCYRTIVCLSVCDISVLWANDWMDQDPTWYGGRPRPRRHC